MDWLDLLAVQGTRKSFLQHHSSKASILWHSAFFTVQLSQIHMTTGKTIALTRWTFVGKVISLLCNMLSRLDITFLPRSKRLLISWLQSPSEVTLATKITLSKALVKILKVIGPKVGLCTKPMKTAPNMSYPQFEAIYYSTFSWHNFQLFCSVQSLSHVRLFSTAWTAACQASLSFAISWSLFKLMPIKSVMLSNHLILYCPLLLLPLIFARIRVFSNESALCITWPKYWSFSFSISPSNEYSGLVSFRIDSFDLLAVQGALKSLLQHHSLKAQFFGT